ncbi:ABC transporter ATP-binding protein [Pediococcus acidilactici]|uniref:ABC transporter ATP-binding protein n=1 Tax=Pediococcus acidilactici TaxID=1254 RepID=UPI00194E117A|nr:ATP-binding cassette domain-containing protein [Pediococcus acidilactici]MBM6586267.1 ATP-binding cassette domain-containing protein [Pediococcus acidilactici]
MLKVKNVNVYIGSKEIIQNATFQVVPGAIVGLIGPNGAGKTTIMKTILGLTKFKGNISLSETEVTENDHSALAKVGALIEHPAIYPFLSGYQNLELYSKDVTDVEHIISILEMNNYIKNKAKNYSLGMKQKLGIAIALLNHPDLIILDEPMNGLDIEATVSIRRIIKKYAKEGTAFLISSHVLSELQKVMTHVVLINEGKIIVNKNINDFNSLSHNNYKLIAENFELAKQLFSSKGISFDSNEDEFVIKRGDLFKIQDILYTNGLHVKELIPLKDSFEQIIINLLNKQRGKQDGSFKGGNV